MHSRQRAIGFHHEVQPEGDKRQRDYYPYPVTGPPPEDQQAETGENGGAEYLYRDVKS